MTLLLTITYLLQTQVNLTVDIEMRTVEVHPMNLSDDHLWEPSTATRSLRLRRFYRPSLVFPRKQELMKEADEESRSSLRKPVLFASQPRIGPKSVRNWYASTASRVVTLRVNALILPFPDLSRINQRREIDLLCPRRQWSAITVATSVTQSKAVQS